MQDQVKIWSPQIWVVGDDSPTWVELSATTETFSSIVDLKTKGYFGSQVQVEINFDDATPVADIEIAFYSSINGVNFDDIPFYKMTISNTDDPGDLGFLIDGWAYFKAGFKQTVNDTDNLVRASIIKWHTRS